MEAQTFSPRAGRLGVHLVDADTARYGDFDDVHLVGLIEREWPDKAGRTIFYPLTLLNQLGWPPERLRLAGARAAFRDLLRLAGGRVSVSTFVLEDDALVEPSPPCRSSPRASMRSPRARSNGPRCGSSARRSLMRAFTVRSARSR